MTDSPSQLLSRAADRVRELAAAATPGPWQACEPWIAGDEYPVYVQTVTTEGYPNSDVAGMAVESADDGTHGGVAIGDARWIATMSPAVAPYLEAILRRDASDYELHVAAWKSTPRKDGEVDRLVEQQFGAALSLAHAILEGEQ